MAHNPQSSLFSLHPSMAVGGAGPSAAAAISTPSSTTNGGEDSTPSADSTDYFFGFIVTFVVLLLLFVSCGFGSRRRSALLSPLWARGDHEGAEGGGRFFGGGRGQIKPALPTPPVFWETWLVPQSVEQVPSRWENLQPISATFMRMWATSRRSVPHPPEPPPQPSLLPPNAIKIAVMISMPSPFTSQQGKGEGSSTLIYPTSVAMGKR
ncbi:hypothetical protein EDC04DRAFT_2602139 [Pisolithus marmoratus]|nr:hypothetical protein EDC04DRAFT_2602139 [Pisolithus marmoratus]